MTITVLHVREPDAACCTRVFVDGVEVPFSEENVDAGAGWDAESWRKRITEWEADPPSPLRDAVLEVLGDPPGAEYIEGWGD